MNSDYEHPTTAELRALCSRWGIDSREQFAKALRRSRGAAGKLFTGYRVLSFGELAMLAMKFDRVEITAAGWRDEIEIAPDADGNAEETDR